MRRSLLCVIALAAVGAWPALADIDNGTFLTPPSGSPFVDLSSGSTDIPGWLVIGGTLDPTGGSVDWINNYWQAPPPGGYSVDLDGFTPGGISQALTLGAGSYVLTFYLAGNPDGPPATKTVQVTAGTSSSSFTFTLASNASESNMGWTQESYDFTTLGGPTVIAFQSADPTSEPNGALPAYGPVVGGVSLTQVPEADFYVYSTEFALCLSGLLMFVRRKRQA
jgi:choice-of-anchor C domain-containing protein